MITTRVSEDLEECARLWDRCWPQQCVFDLWQVRSSFAKAFDRRPYFMVAEQNGRLEGLMALSWIEEDHYFGQFPGETYHSRTWLEQNRIPASSPQVLEALLDCCPKPLALRYLCDDPLLRESAHLEMDEEGFLFFPGHHAYSFSQYMQTFSGKSRKSWGENSPGWKIWV